MRAWHLAAVAMLLLGCDNPATQQEPTSAPSSRGGPTYERLRLLPQGAVFSADGKLLLTNYVVENKPIRPSKGPSVVLWEVDTGKKLWGADDTENLEPLGFLADGKTALVRDYHHGYPSLQVWDLLKGRRLRSFLQTPNEYVHCVSLSHNGKFALMVVYPRGKTGSMHLALWDVALQKPIREFTKLSPYDSVYRLLFSSDDRLAISMQYASKRQPLSVILWDIRTGKMVRSFSMERYVGTLTGFFPDSQRAFCRRPNKQDSEAELGIWEVSTGRELRQLKIPPGAARVCAPDNQHLLFSGAERLSYVDCASGKVIWDKQVGSIGFYLSSVALSRNGKLAFTGIGWAGFVPRGGSGMKLMLWDVKKGEVLRELSDPGWTK